MFKKILSKVKSINFEYKKGSLGRKFTGELSNRLKISRRNANAISTNIKKLFSPKQFLLRKFFAKSYNPNFRVNGKSKYFLTSTKDLDSLDVLINHCENIVKKKKNKFSPNSNRFTFNLIDYEIDKLDMNVKNIEEIRPIFDFFTQEKILSTVIEYMKEIPVIGNVCLFYSFPHKGSFGSEKFHLDQQSKRQLHVVLPVNDINHSNGPFSFLDAVSTKIVLKKEKYLGGRMEDNDVFGHIKKNELIQFKSSKGKNILFVDPYHCLHYGARAKSRQRALLVFNYTSKFEGSETAHGLYRMKNRSLLQRKNSHLDKYLLNL